MRKRLVMVALATVVAGSAAMQGQQGAQLSSLDFYQIQELNARYNQGLDSGDGTLFASVFTADGVLMDETGKSTTGRDQLAAHAAAMPVKGPTNPSHFFINLVVDPAPGGAISKTHAMIGTPRQGATPGKMVVSGQYWDDLVKAADGWKIKKRTFHKAGTPWPGTQELATKMPSFAPTPAAQKSPNGLTLADYTEIYQLYAKSAVGYDFALENGRVYAGVFTPDGTLYDGIGGQPLPKPGITTSGRDKIQEFIAMRGPVPVGTYITNIMIEQAQGGLNVRASLVKRDIPQAPAPALEEPAGMIYDQLTKTNEGWRIRSRHVLPANTPVPAQVATAFKTR